MSYDTKLAERVREHLADEDEITEVEMFGGLGYLLAGNLFVGVSARGGLLVRVPPAGVDRALSHAHTEPMVLAGRPRPGWVRVSAEGVRTRAQLAEWVSLAAGHAHSLSPRTAAGGRPSAVGHRTRASAAVTGRGLIRDFDGIALWEALDARRREHGLTWSGVASEMWELSSELNRRRPSDHPISPSMLRGMGDRGDSSCQHALFMLRWLGESPETFLRGGGTVATFAPLPQCPPDRRLRWDLGRTYAALDAARRDHSLTWPELARELDCTPSQLTGIRTARFAIGMGLAMRIVQWLRRPAADFISPARW